MQLTTTQQFALLADKLKANALSLGYNDKYVFVKMKLKVAVIKY